MTHLFTGEAEHIKGWAEHGMPDNSSTRQHAVEILQRQERVIAQLWVIVDQLLDECHCRVGDAVREQLALEVQT